ncbi:flagellar protein FliT [Methylotuvimicrobium alcaliphilum]|uniref:Flagellar protein FliT n=1 Tax=Methylotuvimicrobium alcaliphilum (strain DSM 19304 / NCIMB 14124 / VKM B-2133 / 20Z) TaxID=1091494 RepID=G4T1M3_META2|nr:flagellar protein FliT [Methylotuvimicrobium alcaliphilum]CCE22445.1 conserved protein of unknown function [Methylotuvimicrobium alcaliphilum 20Z]
MDSVNDLIKELTAFSDLIGQAIDDEKWEYLNDLLARRQDCLERLFSRSDGGEDKNELSSLLRKVQREDEHYMAKVQARKLALQKEAGALNQGRKSIKAYQVISDDFARE